MNKEEFDREYLFGVMRLWLSPIENILIIATNAGSHSIIGAAVNLGLSWFLFTLNPTLTSNGVSSGFTSCQHLSRQDVNSISTPGLPSSLKRQPCASGLSVCMGYYRPLAIVGVIMCYIRWCMLRSCHVPAKHLQIMYTRET